MFLDDALKEKHQVIYLMDNETSVVKFEDPDIYQINKFLLHKSKNDIIYNKFVKDCSFFHFVNINTGSKKLINIFSDEYLLKTTLHSICVLDGDEDVEGLVH